MKYLKRLGLVLAFLLLWVTGATLLEAQTNWNIPGGIPLGTVGQFLVMNLSILPRFTTISGDVEQGLRNVTDGVENSTTTFTSATANFQNFDVGSVIAGSGIPNGTTISSVTNPTTVIMSAAATQNASSINTTIGTTPGQLFIIGLTSLGNIVAKLIGGPYYIYGYDINGNYDTTAFGVLADGKRVTDGAITGTMSVLTSATGGFAASDCSGPVHGNPCTGSYDKMVIISGAGVGGANLETTIVGYTNTNTVTVAATASTTQTATVVNWGTDNATTIAAAYTAAGANISGNNGYGAELHFQPGRIMASGNLVFNKPWISVVGSGKNNTQLVVGGDGTTTACSGGAHGVIQLFGTNAVYTGFHFVDGDDVADCFINFSSASSLSATGADWIVTTDSVTPLTTDPVGVSVGSLTNSSIFRDVTVGNGIGVTPWKAAGFREGIRYIGFSNGVNMENITLLPNSRDFAASVFNDAVNPQLFMIGQGAAITGGVFEFGPNGIQLDAINSQAQNIAGVWFGDLGASAKIWWMPSESFANATSFVIPETSTTVSGACSSGAATCVVASPSSFYVGEKITIQGSGAASADGYYNIVSCGAVGYGNNACTTTLTFNTNILTTPAGGSYVAAAAYEGHVYRAAFQDSAGNCTSGSTQPTWPTNGTSVSDGTCTWQDYGPGAAIYNTGTAANSYDIVGNFISSFPIGVLNQNPNGSMAIMGGNEFFTNQVYNIALIGGASTSVTGNTFNGSANQPNILHADSSTVSDSILWTVNNVQSATPCVVDLSNATRSYVFSRSTLCGVSTAGITQYDTMGGILHLPLAMYLIDPAAATVAAVIQGASAQTADLMDWNSSAGAVLAKVDKLGNISTTVNLSATGNLSITGTQQYPSPLATSIAGLPTCNTAAEGLTGYEVNNATDPCGWMATPVATSSPIINYPVRCVDGLAWRCSN